ncbi:MAG: methionine synthase [Alistipes sp.]|jgi:5-methyltetrahydrofolate--homocysteine methyltransferase|nr:methionine synthase [Alistipes sp.]
MTRQSIFDALKERILVLDGAMGTMVQRYGLEESDFRGGNGGGGSADGGGNTGGGGNTRESGWARERFKEWAVPLKGCNDVLVLTRPDVISAIHRAYLDAGADIISTDSFNANAISMADYGLQEFVYEMNREAARVARSVADEFSAANPLKSRYVAGSMGPTNRTAALAANADDPAAREVTFAQLADAYYDQARGLVDGGADVLLVETVFDTLNAKAALFAISRLGGERGEEIPVMVSGTIADTSGRILSGQTVEAFYASVAHGGVLSIGLNCAFGARQMLPYLERLAETAECRISTHPNAGLPNLSGGYDETPAQFAAEIEEYMRRGTVNIVGGCCGTTPEHTRLVAELATQYSPRPLPGARHETVLSGLEPLTVSAEKNFLNIGERANVAGSAKFARLVREEKWDEAVAVARDQVAQGAQIVDVCMDDGMIDGVSAMRRFLLMAAAEPELARVPMMIDSSSWEVLEAGLQCVQGKSIVNSISLKEGEAEFLRRAGLVRRYGAAAVVMLFDEKGQADTFARKIEVAERAYKLLVNNGFPPEDIVFDPNVLAIATGIAAHDNYAVDFIEATRWIKQNLPHARVSAGVSNLSFSFRGNSAVREAMHSVFLFHATRAGLDMGIVNAGMLQIYSEIEPRMLELVEDVVLNRRPDATERLSAHAEELKAAGEGLRAGTGEKTIPIDQQSVSERIRQAVLKGRDDNIASDAVEAYRELGSPMLVIDTLLMPAMGEVGGLFGEGKMFLPQVVKSARVMRRAVDALNPYLSSDKASAQSAGKLLLATVRGDVHDIGKNIVGVVASTAGWEVIDLGVMVEAGKIADEAQRNNVDIIGLSGLITPSLDEMIRVVGELERRGVTIPVIVGGATTSRLHTAVKIAPQYSGVVAHSRDASENVRIMAGLTGVNSENFIAEVRAQQQLDRELHNVTAASRSSLPLNQARAKAHVKSPADIAVPLHTGRVVFSDHSIAAVEPYINWSMFYAAWQVRGNEQKEQLRADAQTLLERIKSEHTLRLEGVAGVFPARRGRPDEGPGATDDIVVIDPKTRTQHSHGNIGNPPGAREWRLPQLRNQAPGATKNLSVADYVAGDDTGHTHVTECTCGACNSTPGGQATAPQDYIGAFALTAGVGLAEFTAQLRASGDEYNAIMAKLLADRLTEAFAETVHEFIRRVAWGFQVDEAGNPVEIAPQDAVRNRYRGLRYAFGYPATPDHSLKEVVFELLGVRQTTSMSLTDNYMITPGEALCGLIVADADAQYFTLGALSDEQIDEYAHRRGKPVDEIKRLIINS